MSTPPFIFTLFGASGDLARLKLFPSLYQIGVQKKLPEKYHIVGFARTKKTDEEFRKEFRASIEKKYGKLVDQSILEKMLERVHYFAGDYSSKETFTEYHSYLSTLVKATLTDIDHLAYYSVPPVVFKDITQNLAESFGDAKKRIKLIIEKPFGDSADSAEELFHFVLSHFDEAQVYLLDHYLGKFAVQSILQLRHANRIMNHMMKGSELANIQITALENIGIGERVGYFENTGIIKDMVQSHLLQTLALVTMSIPITEDADSVHRERSNILRAVHAPHNKDDIILGQYGSYRKENGVPENSNTETFVGLRLFIDRESWYNVPIYLRTGKKTCEKHTFVVIELKKFAFQSEDEEPNRLVIELQPEEKISIKLLNKVGSTSDYQEVSTSDNISCKIDGASCLPDHASLILDAIQGRTTNFLSFPEIIATWKVTDKVLQVIKNEQIKPDRYEDGTCGPMTQHDLTSQDGYEWYDVHLPGSHQ